MTEWTIEPITDDKTMEVLAFVANELAGLTLHEDPSGRVLVFIDLKQGIRHAAINGGESQWTCFCKKNINGECAATSYARVRVLQSLER